jgi:hypothetical protein
MSGKTREAKLISTDDVIKKGILSSFIIIILGLQLMPVVTKIQGQPSGGWFWPFTDYPMYFGSHQEGEHVNVGYSVVAITSSGDEIFIAHTDHDVLGLNWFKFQQLCFNLKKHDDYLQADLFTSLHPRGDEIVRLEIYNYPVIVTKNGPADADAELLNAIDITPKSMTGVAK